MPESPLVEQISWGEVLVRGHGKFRDAKLFPGGAIPWDWKLTGTHHVPGIQPADVQDLLEAGAEEIVLTRGMLKVSRTQEETLSLLRDRGVVVHVEETRAAVERYNQLVERGVAVGALVHSTC